MPESEASGRPKVGTSVSATSTGGTVASVVFQHIGLVFGAGAGINECNRLFTTTTCLGSDQRSWRVSSSTQNQYHEVVPSSRRVGRLGALLVVLLLLPGCNALNPLCGSARPVPILNSISPTSVIFSQLPPSFVLTATGSQFVSSSVLVFNGATLVTTVKSSSQLTVTISSSMIPAPGSFNVAVQTPAGNSGDVGCSSGGTSSARVMTVN